MFSISKSGVSNIYDKVMANERLNFEDGLTLFSHPDLTFVAALASHVRFQKHENKTHYVVNRQINYTNICVNGCAFCAFRRDNDSQAGAFCLSHADIHQRLKDASNLDEVHIVGGCHPHLDFSWFKELIASIRRLHPSLPIKAFTPVEIAHFAKQEGVSTKEILRQLQEAGLNMLPGGGAEIFSPVLRQQLCPHKANAKQWLEISGEAHALGLKTNCTMLFGHLETYEDRVDHLLQLREQQDKSKGFTCFIPLPFLKENSRLKLPPEKDRANNALDQLRTIAVSRLILDNIDHIKAYWIMLGEKLAQTALWYGADDLDGTIVEERIGHMAGARSAQGLTIAQLEQMIRDSGFIPVRRNATFEILNTEG